MTLLKHTVTDTYIYDPKFPTPSVPRKNESLLNNAHALPHNVRSLRRFARTTSLQSSQMPPGAELSAFAAKARVFVR